jgi:membrane protein YqaA with SNARE-associated domain
MLRRLYDRLIRLAAGPNAVFWLGLTAFAEASFFPLPPDLLLIPMVVAAPARAWRLAAICTICSAAGGVLGWEIGAAFFTRVALPIARAYHAEASLLHFAQTFRDYGLWVILAKGLTPIPYKIVSIAAGAAHFNLGLFVLASLATRGARFFLWAALLRRYGEPVRHFVERRLMLATSVVVVAAVAGVVAVKYL